MFCSNCGRPLIDGEICECQKQAKEADATLNAAAAQADAVINNTPQATVDPIKARIEKESAEQAARAAAAQAAATQAAQNANNRANQYYQQYTPQNQPGMPSQSPNGQYGIPNQAQYAQANAQQPMYGQAGNPYGNQPNGQYGQAGVPYGGQGYNRSNPYSGNPYGNNQVPPAYYQQPTYDTDEERLRKYMSNPKFVAARDIMGSPIVLFYAISVSALLLFNFIALQSFLHPLLILLSIAAWITYGSGISSKKNNTLPSTSGLSIGSGVAITMLVIWCIAFGLCILIMLLGIIGVLSAGRVGSAAGAGILALVICLCIFILVLVFGIKYYSLQSRNLKGLKYCITNEANPSRFSIFPSVILIIGIVLSIVGLFVMEGIYGSSKLQNAVYDYLINYFGNSGIDSIKSGFSRELAEQLVDKIFSREARIMSYVSNILSILTMGSTAGLYISIKSKLNEFSEI